MENVLCEVAKYSRFKKMYMHMCVPLTVTYTYAEKLQVSGLLSMSQRENGALARKYAQAFLRTMQTQSQG